MSDSQYRIDETTYPEVAEEINRLEDRLATAVQTNDAQSFQDTLARLVERVRRYGRMLPESEVAVSDVIVPPADITLAETRSLLARNSLVDLGAAQPLQSGR
jgi:hypothetical protein